MSVSRKVFVFNGFSLAKGKTEASFALLFWLNAEVPTLQNA